MLHSRKVSYAIYLSLTHTHPHSIIDWLKFDANSISLSLIIFNQFVYEILIINIFNDRLGEADNEVMHTRQSNIQMHSIEGALSIATVANK